MPETSRDSLSVSLLKSIDHICRRFEAAWKEGNRPKIEDYLGEMPEPARSHLRRELQAIEQEMRQRSQRRPSLQQFRRTLVDSGLMTDQELNVFLDGLPPDQPPQTAEDLARALFQHGKLTRFQVQAVFQGKTRGLVLGNYVVLDKLGEGGMGQVYKAQHRKMKRVVAVKMLPSSLTRSAEAVKRFQREVEAAAKLAHPNIVEAYDANEAQDMHFLAMEFVEGSDLARLIRQQGPLPVATAIDYLLQAARGLEYAHAQGVIHRDIKPSNLLVDCQGTLKVLDLGLARLDDATRGLSTGLTQTGQMMGTFDFMSPEQTLNTHAADARSDIYSLGCTLHYLLTGRAPYEEANQSLGQKIVAHREQPIPSLRATRPDVPEPLDTLFQQMLAKRVEDRVKTMHVVIQALDNLHLPRQSAGGGSSLSPPVVVPATVSFHASEVETSSEQRSWADELAAPPQASVPSSSKRSPLDRLARRFRSRPKLAVGLGVTALGLVVLLGVILSLKTPYGTVRIELSDPKADVEVTLDGDTIDIAGLKDPLQIKPGNHALKVTSGEFETVTQQFTVRGGQEEVVRISLAPKPASPEGVAQETPPSADKRHRDAVVEAWRSQFPLYRNRILLASAAIDHRDISEATRQLNDCPEAMRKWEWFYLQSRLDQAGRVLRVGYPSCAVAFESNGRPIAVVPGDSGITVKDVRSGEDIPQSFKQIARNTHGPCMAITSGGQHVAIPRIDSEENINLLYVFHRVKGDVFTIRMEDRISRLALSPDGRLVCGASERGKAVVWDAHTGSQLQQITDASARDTGGARNALCFAPDQSQVAFDNGTEVGLYDLKRKSLRFLKGHYQNVTAIAFSRPGRYLVSGSRDMTIRVWDAATDEPVMQLRGHHAEPASALCFSLDEQRIAAGHGDGVLNVWDMRNQARETSLLGHSGAIGHLTFNNEGNELLSSGCDGEVKLWRMDTEKSDEVLHLANSSRVTCAAFTPTGNVVAGNESGELAAWNVATGRQIWARQPTKDKVYDLSVSPDGALIVAVGTACQVHNPRDGTIEKELARREDSCQSVAYSPVGGLVAVANCILDARTFEQRTRLTHARTCFCAFTPDGRSLAWIGTGGSVGLADAADGGVRWEKQLGGDGRAVAVSADGSRIAAIGNCLQIFDARDGRELETLARNWNWARNAPSSIVFFPDGSRFAVGLDDGSIVLCDYEKGDSIFTLTGHTGPVTKLAVSPDGKTLASASADGTVRLWKGPSRHLETRERSASADASPNRPRQGSPRPSARSVSSAAPVSWPDSQATPRRASESKTPDESSEPRTVITNSIGMKLVLVPAGEFTMGSRVSPEQLAKRGARFVAPPEQFENERPRHRVRITRPFYLGAYEVTQEEYEKVVKQNPSDFKGPKNPVEKVRWYEAAEDFCGQLSKREGRQYRLPTEAEWEYACRAGSSTEWCFGDDESRMAEYAWFADNSNKATHLVGQKQPNAWGLFDLHGNVSEWCADWHSDAYYNESPGEDPKGPASGPSRVVRGGSWNSVPAFARSAYRSGAVRGYVNGMPDYGHDLKTHYLGFRVARDR